MLPSVPLWGLIHDPSRTFVRSRQSAKLLKTRQNDFVRDTTDEEQSTPATWNHRL